MTSESAREGTNFWCTSRIEAPVGSFCAWVPLGGGPLVDQCAMAMADTESVGCGGGSCPRRLLWDSHRRPHASISDVEAWEPVLERRTAVGTLRGCCRPLLLLPPGGLA